MPPRNKSTKLAKPVVKLPGLVTPSALLTDLRDLIRESRGRVAQAINSALVLLYWEVGNRLRIDVLGSKRAGYGDDVLRNLATHLSAEFGPGFAEKSLRRMMQLAVRYPERAIVATLSRQLGWSHFVEIIPIDDPLKREFYAEMCRVHRWSVRALRDKI